MGAVETDESFSDPLDMNLPCISDFISAVLVWPRIAKSTIKFAELINVFVFIINCDIFIALLLEKKL